jgi:multidrug efflux pump subunit AcrA (membrane-fusion protein)
MRLLGEQGQYVVKDPKTGAFYQIGDEEFFLLMRLNGEHTAEALCHAYEAIFDQPLSLEDLNEFIDTARSWGFLQPDKVAQEKTAPVAESEPVTADMPPASRPARARQSILHWRFSLFDPDHLFTWLAPKIGFFWTRGFVCLSGACILSALALVWCNRGELTGTFGQLGWETAILAWLTLAVVTTCHEFAHGLTCKHHGGEVHEIGFLLIFFMPAFFCNVSDAWLFWDKKKRLWVTLAGGYCELFLWSLAVFIWRLTMPETLWHHLAWVIVSVCGIRVLFNFNPLLKLDGYYLLSDGLDLPNLRQRALHYLMGHVRWLLWGAARPAAEARSRWMLVYGLACWLYSVAFLLLSLFALGQLCGSSSSVLGLVLAVVLCALSLPGLFQGVSSGEFSQMLQTRHRRTLLWGFGLAAGCAALGWVEIEDRVGGSFQVHSADRTEVRAPVAGFVRMIQAQEGQAVAAGTILAELEVPDLASRQAQKEAEVREAQAKLRLLEVGPRPEEVREHRYRVGRARAWCDQAEADLKRARQAHQEDVRRMEQQLIQYGAELDYARQALARARGLLATAAATGDEHDDAQRRLRVNTALFEQVQAQKRACEALGTRDAEAELARRARDLADAEAALHLLEAGSRPEEIDAERCRLNRLREEARYLTSLQHKRLIVSPADGTVETPHLREKIGQYLHEGDLLCVLEEADVLEAEITLSEQDAGRVRAGQAVALKARALPFETHATEVNRVAPVTGHGETQGTVTVYCALAGGGQELRPGTTGYARVYTGRRSLGRIGLDWVLRLVRTEFWW